MTSMKVFLCCLLFYSCQITVQANVIRFDYQRVGSYRSDGLYNLFGLGTWNGQPVTADNKPSDYNRQLASMTNFFVSPSASNELLIQITDVITTNASWWTGTAFDNVSQTGLRFWLPATRTMSLGVPTFSDVYANPGELLFTGNGTETIPLSNTPGYMLSNLGSGMFSIHTANGTDSHLAPGAM